MDASTFRIIRLEGQAFDCPLCRARHSWSQNDAWVEVKGETPSQQRASSPGIE